MSENKNFLMDEIDFSLEKTLEENINADKYFGFPLQVILDTENMLHNPKKKKVAYFSMEFGLSPSFYNTFISQGSMDQHNKKRDFAVFSNMRSMDYFHMVRMDTLVDLPIYSGGLGVLAGDTLKSVADLGLPLIGVGILWNKGYFLQRACIYLGQEVEEINWNPLRYPGLAPLRERIEIAIGTERVVLRLWKYYVFSHDRTHVVPLILLDSNLEENGVINRKITDRLYNSKTDWWKSVQRKVLGVGGIKALKALGYDVDLFHLNEGHAALAFVEMAKDLTADKLEALKKQFVYTCHTPVEAGHDRLPVSELKNVLDERELELALKLGTGDYDKQRVNLTLLALNAAHKANAVSERHEQVTKIQFPDYVKKIEGITNGIHHLTWVSEPMAQLFDQYVKEIGPWRSDPTTLKNVLKLTEDNQFKQKLWDAHMVNKHRLVKWLSPWLLKEHVFTIAWARRAASYKRPELILYDLDKLLSIAKSYGCLQVILAGKAHPKDKAGTHSIRNMLGKIDSLVGKQDNIKVLYLEDYDTYVGKMLVSGVDVWLNNPLPPFEASGTSGMKAILNGVPQLSTSDGWIAEAHQNIGIIFGYAPPEGEIGCENDFRIQEDANSLYRALSQMIALYQEAAAGQETMLSSQWLNMMIHCIAEAAFFNTHRMAKDYNAFAWGLKPGK